MIVAAGSLLTGCNPLQKTESKAPKTSKGLSISNLDYGSGFVLTDDPITLSGNSNLDENANLSSLVSRSGVFVTSNANLIGSCSLTFGITTGSLTNCFKVTNDRNASLIAPVNGKWPYTANSKEFLDVHTYYHVNKAATQFHSSLGFGVTKSASLSSNYSSLPNSVSNIASDISFWDTTRALNVFSNCAELTQNALFNPANYELCFGVDPAMPDFKFSQDPSIIYHEIGHAFVYNMMNLRNNMLPRTTTKTNLTGSYHEAGAINEGIADYFSFVQNQRTFFGLWGTERFYEAGRPISEDQEIHAYGISTASDSRLSYPTYLNYEVHSSETAYKPCGPLSEADPTVYCSEDIHYAGQITSHYLVALTRDLKSTCYFNHDSSTKYIQYILAETLAELGDIKGQGKNSAVLFGTFSNLTTTENEAYTWSQIANPVNYRRFYQTFARNLVKIISDVTVCPMYTQSQAERLLDDYGLLLFKTYNDNGNDRTLGRYPTGTVQVTQVSNANRVKSVMTSKTLIALPSSSSVTTAYVFDSQTQIQKVLEILAFSGNPVQLLSTPADLRYNNNNGRISPGEVVGLLPNLINNSNIPMAGVQILANDWDHAETVSGKYKACTLSDGWPLTSEGAADSTGSEATSCSTLTTTNAAVDITPICYVQYRATNETKWISQLEYKRINSDFPCLDNSNQKNCLIRVIPQASQAFYSKIDPGKNWADSLTSGISGARPRIGVGNMILFEVNKWIPPGTTFNCRMRVRFTNCTDCFHDPLATDSDDYRDYEYAGEKPFKVINFQIPVVD